jgi:hypothetical protein
MVFDQKLDLLRLLLVRLASLSIALGCLLLATSAI